MIKKTTIRHGKSKHPTWVFQYAHQPIQIWVDPGYCTAEELKGKQEPERIIILITSVILDTCAYIPQVKHEVGASFYTHQDFLPQIQFLPQMGRNSGLCGVHIPMVDVVWDKQKGCMESLDMDYQRLDQPAGKRVQYRIGPFVV